MRWKCTPGVVIGCMTVAGSRGSVASWRSRASLEKKVAYDPFEGWEEKLLEEYRHSLLNFRADRRGVPCR
jgi:hypothetical protein